MRISTLLVLCALIVAATAQTFSIASPSGSTVTVGVMTDWFFVTASVNPNVSVSVSISEGTGNVEQLSSSSLSFSTQTRQLSFRFVPKVVGIITFDLSLSSTDQFTIPATFAVYSAPRPIYWDGAGVLSSIPMGYPSEPIKVYIETPYTSAISLTPSFTVYISGESVPLTVVPSTITIPAGALSASFRVIAGYTEFGNNVEIAWGTISGDSNDWYEISDDIISMNFYRRSRPSSSALSSNFLVGTESNILYFYTAGDRPNDTLTVTPQAADTTFSPSSINLDANTQVAQFTILTTSTEDNKPVYFYLSSPAAGYYNQIPAGSLNVPKRQFEIDVPDFFFVTKPSKMSIKIEYPVPADVTIEFYAANLAFEPASISFTSAGETAFDVAITAFHTGSDIISFKVTGTNAAWFATPGDINVGIYGGSITGPDQWYIPALFVGQESDRLPMRLNFAPATDIVVTPTAPDFVFNPPNFTFTPNTVSTYFTVTPTVARSAPVAFAVSGTDWAWFIQPGSATLEATLRPLQAVWSSDIMRGDKFVIYSGTSHTVWVSTNYVGRSDSFTVTPVSAYFKFSPEVLNFNSGTLRASFTATPIAGSISSGEATITYVVSGQAAGYYDSLGTQSISIVLRPLYFYSAVLSWDTRNPVGTYVNATQLQASPYNAANAAVASEWISNSLGSNHVNSFSIATDAFPGSKLTITPKSAHISFSPSSVTLTASSATTVWGGRSVSVTRPPSTPFTWSIPTPTYLAIANFTVSGNAPGRHDVWFELSSDDAGYYIAPQHTQFTIYKYSGGGSASSTVVASIGMIIASVVLALFL